MKIRKLRVAALMTATAFATMMMLAACGEKPVEHTHTLQQVAAVAATCTTAGTEAYYKCTDPECGKLFSDDKGETEITAAKVVPAKGHNMTKHEAVTATCTGEGTVEYYTCANEAADVYYADNQGAQKLETISTPKTNHQLVGVPQKDATCAAAGTEAYWNCLTCQHKFSDDKGEHEIDAPIEIPKSKEHGALVLKMEQDKIPDPVEGGGSLEQVCSVCGQSVESIQYDVGIKGIQPQGTGTQEIEVGKKYYGTTFSRYTAATATKPEKWDYFQDLSIGFKVSAAGIYKLDLRCLVPQEGEIYTLWGMWVDASFQTRNSASKMVIYLGKVTTDETQKAKFDDLSFQFTEWDSTGGVKLNLSSIVFNVTDENIKSYGSSSGELYIKVLVGGYKPDSASSELVPAKDRVAPFLISLSQQTN